MLRTLFLFSLFSICLSAPAAEQVINLPGLNTTINFNHYSGYLTASSTKFFHYWFTESMGTPSSDPLILWLNGGPGCSSVGGLIEELGPFHVANFGNTVYLNKYAWNQFANVLFIESPAGVGYSYATDGNVATNDDEVALNNHNALVSFLSKFPEYKGRPFYITGESYGGVYLPTLGARLINDKTNFPNFKGMAIGNGVVSFPLNYNTQIPLAYYHGILRDEMYQKVKFECCNGNIETCDVFSGFSNATCRPIFIQALEATDPLDPYNLYDTCYLNGAGKANDFVAKKNFIRNAFRRVIGLPSVAQKVSPSRSDSGTPLCAQTDNTAIYMNRADVRTALHIPSSLPTWSDCSNVVSNNYQTTHLDVYPEITAISSAGVQILMYNGDVDTVCNHVMNTKFITGLNRTILGVAERVNEAWTYSEESPDNAGMQTSYSGGLDFLTVRGSGHFVPGDRPREALQMIHNFVNNRGYSSHYDPYN